MAVKSFIYGPPVGERILFSAGYALSMDLAVGELRPGEFASLPACHVWAVAQP
jgi:hypothetical protein